MIAHLVCDYEVRRATEIKRQKSLTVILQETNSTVKRRVNQPTIPASKRRGVSIRHISHLLINDGTLGVPNPLKPHIYANIAERLVRRLG